MCRPGISSQNWSRASSSVFQWTLASISRPLACTVEIKHHAGSSLHGQSTTPIGCRRLVWRHSRRAWPRPQPSLRSVCKCCLLPLLSCSLPDSVNIHLHLSKLAFSPIFTSSLASRSFQRESSRSIPYPSFRPGHCLSHPFAPILPNIQTRSTSAFLHRHRVITKATVRLFVSSRFESLAALCCHLLSS